MTVVGTEGAVTPHSGTKMVRGASGQNQYISQEWYNAAFRQNAQPYQYFVELDYWFYDPLGSGGVSFMDYMALTYYSLAPNSTDYPAGQDLNPSTTRERLGLGAASFQGVGFDSTKYQARVLGTTGDYGSGWFNTSVTRSVGWHHGQIIFGNNKGDGTADVEFRIDGALAFSHSSVQNVGVNSIEMNSNYGDTDGYFDDVRLGVVPEPSTTVLLLCGAAMLLRLRRQRP